jgi:hypothetical protein
MKNNWSSSVIGDLLADHVKKHRIDTVRISGIKTQQLGMLTWLWCRLLHLIAKGSLGIPITGRRSLGRRNTNKITRRQVWHCTNWRRSLYLGNMLALWILWWWLFKIDCIPTLSVSLCRLPLPTSKHTRRCDNITRNWCGSVGSMSPSHDICLSTSWNRFRIVLSCSFK